MVKRNSWLGKITKPMLISLCYLFVYLPIIVLVVFSFNSANSPHAWSGFSLTWYKKVFASEDMISALSNSIFIAFTSTLISIILGTALVVASKWWQPFWMFPIFLPNMVTPEIVMAVGLLSLFYFFKIPLGYTSLIAGHTVIGLGYCVPILRNKFARLDPVLTEASQDLGATYWQTLYKVLLPLLTPSMVAAAFLVFTISLDDFFIAFFCSGPAQLTIATYVYAQIRAIPTPSLNALSSLLLLFSSSILLLLSMTKISKEIINND